MAIRQNAPEYRPFVSAYPDAGILPRAAPDETCDSSAALQLPHIKLGKEGL